MSAWRRRLAATAGFALLALLTELTGRSIVVRLDRAFHVVPLATPTTSYYPFLLAGVRALGALLLRGSPGASSRRTSPPSPRSACLAASGTGRTAAAAAAPAVPAPLAPLLRRDLDLVPAPERRRPVAHGRWPLFAPWLHTYALPSSPSSRSCSRSAGERSATGSPTSRSFAAATFESRAPPSWCRSGTLRPPPRPATTGLPRRLFGHDFESRPPLSPPSPRRRPNVRGPSCHSTSEGDVSGIHKLSLRPIGGHAPTASACPGDLADRPRSPSLAGIVWADPPAVPDHAPAPTGPGLLVARDRAAPARRSSAEPFFGFVDRAPAPRPTSERRPMATPG